MALDAKALGLPLRFPGAPGRYHALTMFTDAGLLAIMVGGDKAVFDAWYFTPGGLFGLHPGPLNKQAFVTGRKTGV